NGLTADAFSLIPQPTSVNNGHLQAGNCGITFTGYCPFNNVTETSSGWSSCGSSSIDIGSGLNFSSIGAGCYGFQLTGRFYIQATSSQVHQYNLLATKGEITVEIYHLLPDGSEDGSGWDGEAIEGYPMTTISVPMCSGEWYEFNIFGMDAGYDGVHGSLYS